MIEHRAHTVGNVFPMSSVDYHTFLAVAVVAAGFLAGAVVFVLVLGTKGRGKLFLKAQPLLPVSLVKLLHRCFFNRIVVNNHSGIRFLSYWNNSIIPHFLLEK